MTRPVSSRPLVLEIGTEEMPAAVMPDTLEQLKNLAATRFEEARLTVEGIHTVGTPRRLVLRVQAVAGLQAELRDWVRGPSKEVAFDEDEQPTRAAQGFARGQGVAVDDLVVRDTDNGEYVFAERVEKGQRAQEVLQSLLPGLIEELRFPRTMRWGSCDFHFVRPIRWIVALYGEEIIPFELAGVQSGRTTQGHRTLAPNAVQVNSAAELEAVCKQAFVILDPDERARRIRNQAESLSTEVKGKVSLEGELLEEVVHLVEWPTVFVGQYSTDYLDLPREVLVTSMRVHQRYFPVEAEEGGLLPLFLAVRNGNDRHLELVREGNERVLRARLADARFFYDEDRKRPLEAYVKGLQAVVFQDELGSYYDKLERMREVAASIANALGLSEELRGHVDRATELCKADQITAMVQEFPELEGVMGREYARLAGEPEAVARAIYEHHLPRGMNDELPQTMVGTVVSLADKLDTISGCFAVGIRPSGSQDPYGLRRSALACIRLMHTARLEVDLSVCLDLAVDQHPVVKSKEARAEIRQELMEFFRRRFEGLLRAAGYRYDVIAAVLEAGFDRIPEVWERTAQLQAFCDDDRFADTLTAYIRAHNLAVNAETDRVREELLSADEEIQLYRAIRELEPRVEELASRSEYLTLLQQGAVLREPVDRLLDNVMVMVDEECIRQNRLALLRETALVFGRHFELSQLEID